MSTDVTAKSPAPAPPGKQPAGGRRPAPAGAGRHAPQHAAVRHADRPRPDRGAVRGVDRRRPAAAAQRLQPGAAEQLHPDPRDRHDAGHHRGPHRPVGRLTDRVRRRHGRGPDGQATTCPGRSRWSCACCWAPLAGAMQGFFIAYLGIPSFIVTLAGMLLFRGLTEIFLEGQTLGPFPQGLQKVANGFLPEVGPNTNYHNLTLLLGFALIAFVVCQEVRDRRRQQEFSLDVPPVKLFVLKLVALVAALLTVTHAARQLQGRPGRPAHPRCAGRRLRLRHAQRDHRPPHLRDRRQPAGGQAVRREGQEGHLPGLPEHGHAGGPGRSGLRRPASTRPRPRPASTSSWRPSPRRSSAARR